ncbi:MAG: class I SAM-dependent rRNA methyltransferase [Armatimonadota bacterium]|nr:class I SAM-dependent rRNA methyltransferase [Armatimonadota bacterium]MDR7451691.1 class I SAM-dependent rRNA methyltransferase [Armatimonadota bacterium]MDR7465691.1 class I SAM-dependent rRNA methyltransferase [Armatimonadota bacterium]MDR7493600.1 class I SAM-dependent rRNA methyltransferase [Armatimonadota bacterium]MDR7499496.1 class I SAM-dependent rRNA methyltransferase [Armatimonadota bacterium]
MTTVFLKPGREARVASGHLWVFAGEILRIDGTAPDGAIVDVRSARGRWIGRGFLNRRSQLTVRLLSHRPEPIDEAFFRRRIREAWEYRRRMVPSADACRVVYGEGDLLPGLIVDRYADVLVLQTLSLGMDLRREMLLAVLGDLLRPAAVYERNDPSVRTLEGLPLRTGWLMGQRDPLVEIREGRARFLVDVAGGQKTGFYLDQRDNRLVAAALARDREVLDVFCYTGGFAVQAALGGARSVTAVDSSAESLALARRNAEMNQVAERCVFVEANAFDDLRRRSEGGERFDVVILDPPPFARAREAVDKAAAAYKEINLRALKLLRPGGLLITCSCSAHISETLLQQVVAGAAVDAKREVRLVESRGHPRDHPVHPAMPETRYLTCLILEVR